MNVLVSAYACEPNCGSEPAIAWNLVRELSEKHALTVVTRSNNREAIEGCGEDWIQRVNWEYLDLPPWFTRWKKGRRGVALYYLLWQISLFFRARQLMQEISFSIIHHLTFASVAPPSFLMRLGIPFTAGPLGGAEDPPLAYLQSLPFREAFYFRLRRWRRTFAIVLIGGIRPYRRAAACLAATKAGKELLERAGASHCEVSFQSGLSQPELDKLMSYRNHQNRSQGGPLRLLVASRMIPWKAVADAIEAAALLRDEGINFTMDVTESGPQEKKLHQLVRDRGLDKMVNFLGRLPTHDDFLRRMAACDLLFHPALSESFGQVCLEALAVGVPVACLDWGGPGLIVDPQFGYLIEPSSRQEVIKGFASAGRELLSGNGRTHAPCEFFEQFSWPSLARQIERQWENVSRSAQRFER